MEEWDGAKGFILTTWTPTCAMLDSEYCDDFNAPDALELAPRDLTHGTIAATLRATYGWVNSRKYGWLCPNCARIARGLRPINREDDEAE